MTANSYFEYVLTLLGWLVNNGVWQTLTATGLFALPLLAKLVALWLKARGQGADEGNVAVELWRIGGRQPAHAIAVIAEEAHGAVVARVRLGGDGVESICSNAMFDLSEQQRTEAPALELRLDPQIGDRIVEVLSRAPAADGAFAFDEQNGKPVIGQKTEKCGLGHAPHLFAIGKARDCRLPGPKADFGQPFNVAGAGMADDGHDAGLLPRQEWRSMQQK